MNTRSIQFIRALAFALLPGLLQAQPTAHYVPGVEGIKGASLPPPGFYVRDYNVGYISSRLNGPSGGNVSPPNFSVDTYANVPRVLWISDTTFLGGFVGVDGLLPLVYQSVKAGGFDSSTFGVGDFFAESTLSWHLKQFDVSAGLGTWMPTGESPSQAPPPPSTRAGLGYWTPMLTAGATWYIDSEKTWTVSALNRYEFNSEQRDTHIKPGQAYTLEWGAGKTFNKVIDVGAVGYYQQQTTSDGGASSSNSRDRVAAIGPEVNLAFPKPMLFVSFRYLYEFMAENRAEGHTLVLTLTKRF
jgi:hypothetical protein